MHLVHRKTCRVCGSTALTPVINLGDQYLQGSFVKPGKEEPPLRKIPLTLVRCDPTKDEHAYTLGTDIPIVSEADSRAMKPDYYLVLPWHFKEEFLKREEETLKAGVGMIFPLPTVDVIKS